MTSNKKVLHSVADFWDGPETWAFQALEKGCGCGILNENKEDKIMEEKEISLQEIANAIDASPVVQEKYRKFNEVTNAVPKKKNGDNNDDEQPQKCLKYREDWVKADLHVKEGDDGQPSPVD